MANENQDPGTQDTPLIFGKYKSMEEAEKAFKEQERTLQSEREGRERAERWASLMKSEPEKKTSAIDDYVPASYEEDVELDDAQKRAFKAVEERAVKRTLQVVGDVLEKKEAQKEAWRKFLESNPDLRGAENFVQAEAMDLAGETKGRNIDPEEAFKEVARRVREKIAKLAKTDKKDFHVAHSGDPDHEKPEPKKEDRLPSQDEILSDHIADFRKRKAAQLRINLK